MRKEWLVDYDDAERADCDRFVEQSIKETIPIDYRYPDPKRFPKLREPVSEIYPENVWSQIPLYGTSVLPLAPLPEKEFYQEYGLNGKEDLQHLIELSKDTGRIQFVLKERPITYGDCEFMEPLLSELRPPYYCSVPEPCFDSMANIDKAIVKFETLASIKIPPIMNVMKGRLGDERLANAFAAFLAYYVQLNAFGYANAAEVFENLLIDDPAKAFLGLSLFAKLKLSPRSDPLALFYRAGCNLPLEAVQKDMGIFRTFNQGLPEPDLSKITLPYEVGRFIIRKRALRVGNYQACLSLIDRYEQQDVARLVEAVKVGCEQDKIDLANSKSKELSGAFDNVWADADKVKSLEKRVQSGFTLGLGIVGTVATLPFFGVGGVLAGLGFSVLDTASESTNVSKKIARFFSPNYLVSICDFKTQRIDSD